MPRPISYAVFCLKTNSLQLRVPPRQRAVRALPLALQASEAPPRQARVYFAGCRPHRRGLPSFPTRRSSDLDEAVPSFVSGAMAKAGKGLLEGTLQAGTSAVSDKLLDLVGLGGKSAADKGKDTRDYLAAAFPELNAWERAGADASSAGMV